MKSLSKTNFIALLLVFSLAFVLVGTFFTSRGYEADSAEAQVYAPTTDESWLDHTLASETEDPNALVVERAGGTVYYKVYSAVGLAYISKISQQSDMSSAYITLENDIDLSAYWWAPISWTTYFCGIFDGKGYTISGLHLKSTLNCGLFSTLGCCRIENLKIINSYAVDTTTSTKGMLAGSLNKTGGSNGIDATYVKNVEVQDCIVYGVNGLGGLIGLTEGANIIMEECKSLGNEIVATGLSAGGFVGGFKVSGNLLVSVVCVKYEFKNLTNSSNVSANYYVGGLLGSAMFKSALGSKFVIDNFTNSGILSVTGNSVGGVIGSFNFSDENPPTEVLFTNCYNLGKISAGGFYVAGIMGYYYTDKENHPTFINLNNYGDIESTSTSSYAYIGGIFGHVYSYNSKGLGSYTFINLTNRGQIKSTSHFNGGIAGILNLGKDKATIQNIKNFGNVTGRDYTGGCFGDMSSRNTDAQILENFGDVTSASSYVGGIAGSVSSIRGKTLLNDAAVLGINKVGGFFGRAGSSVGMEVIGGYCAGRVEGENQVGGIIGEMMSSANFNNIWNIIARCDVKGAFEVGGAVGFSCNTGSASYGAIKIDGFDYYGKIELTSQTNHWAAGLIGKSNVQSAQTASAQRVVIRAVIFALVATEQNTISPFTNYYKYNSASTEKPLTCSNNYYTVSISIRGSQNYNCYNNLQNSTWLMQNNRLMPKNLISVGEHLTTETAASAQQILTDLGFTSDPNGYKEIVVN